MDTGVKKQGSVDNDLANLYGSSWFYASYYLLLKSESREGEDGTHYFYKGGREAAYLYEMIGWDFERKDKELKDKFSREGVKNGEEQGLVDSSFSLERYEAEKELVLKATRLGRFLGMDDYKEKIRAFIAAEECTPWFAEHKEESVREAAVKRAMADMFIVAYKDVVPLSSFRDGQKGQYVMTIFGKDTAPEPARFVGVVMKGKQQMYLLEHLREIGTGWSGPNSVWKNIWDNASHDGCLEVVFIPAQEADKMYVGLNGTGSFIRGRLEARCAVSDFARKIKANVLGQKYSLYKGKPMVSLDTLLARYKARNERFRIKTDEQFEKDVERAQKAILKEQDKDVETIHNMGDTSLERLDALLGEEVRRRREEVMARYRSYRPERIYPSGKGHVLEKQRLQRRSQESARDNSMDTFRRQKEL